MLPAQLVPESASKMLAARPALGSFSSIAMMPTELVKLPPAFMEALKKVGPKKRRSRVGYVLALAVVAVMAVLCSDPLTRDVAKTKAKAAVARIHERFAPSTAPQPAAVSFVAARVINAPPTVISSEAPEAPPADTAVAEPKAPASISKAAPKKTSPAKAKKGERRAPVKRGAK